MTVLTREGGHRKAPGDVRDRVLLGIGANHGSPVAQLAVAVERLSDAVSLQACSSVYRSEPVGYREQADFFNLVCCGTTPLLPFDLLAATRRIEHTLGRTRTFPNAPRTIDIDILAYGDLVIRTPELTIPHPRLHLRAFVLVPLNEVAPEWRHPIFRATPAQLLSSGGAFERIDRWGMLPDPAGRIGK